MLCAACGFDNRGGRRFCAECGALLSLACPSCGSVNEAGEKFCGHCGKPLPTPVPSTPVDASRSSSLIDTSRNAVRVAKSVDADIADGERKTVTALFADIKGSMELMEDLDPEEVRAIIDPALKLMIDSVGCYDGYIVQSSGDGIFALFGAPVAHEDHPQRATVADPVVRT